LIVFNPTFNNISVISWRSALLVEETGETTDLSAVTDKLYNIMMYTSLWSRFELPTSVVIGTDCIDRHRQYRYRQIIKLSSSQNDNTLSQNKYHINMDSVKIGECLKLSYYQQQRPLFLWGSSWPCGRWIYYLCNQCLSPLMLGVHILIRARCTSLCDKVCQWLLTGR
jgi:hypothetical protein